MHEEILRSLKNLVSKKGIPGVMAFLSESIGENAKARLEEEKILIYVPDETSQHGKKLIPNFKLLNSI